MNEQHEVCKNCGHNRLNHTTGGCFTALDYWVRCGCKVSCSVDERFEPERIGPTFMEIVSDRTSQRTARPFAELKAEWDKGADARQKRDAEAAIEWAKGEGERQKRYAEMEAARKEEEKKIEKSRRWIEAHQEAFIAEIAEVCLKHRLSISYDELQGRFVVVAYDDEQGMEWDR